MKRSPLKRKTPLKRTPLRTKKQLRKGARIKRQSPKTAKMYRDHREARLALIAQVPLCPFCRVRKSTGVHEIAKGAHRAKGYVEACARIPACWPCNSGDLNNHKLWPLARQLAVLLTVLPENFDLSRFNAIRGRAEGAITREEVEQFLGGL